MFTNPVRPTQRVDAVLAILSVYAAERAAKGLPGIPGASKRVGVPSIERMSSDTGVSRGILDYPVVREHVQHLVQRYGIENPEESVRHKVIEILKATYRNARIPVHKDESPHLTRIARDTKISLHLLRSSQCRECLEHAIANGHYAVVDLKIESPLEAVKQYFLHLKKTGGRLPINSQTGKPHYAIIAAACQISPAKVSSRRRILELLDKAAREFGTELVVATTSETAILAAFVERSIAQGIPAPRALRRPTIAYKDLSRIVSIAVSRLKTNAEMQRLLTYWVDTCGLERRPLDGTEAIDGPLPPYDENQPNAHKEIRATPTGRTRATITVAYSNDPRYGPRSVRDRQRKRLTARLKAYIRSLRDQSRALPKAARPKYLPGNWSDEQEAIIQLVDLRAVASGCGRITLKDLLNEPHLSMIREAVDELGVIEHVPPEPRLSHLIEHCYERRARQVAAGNAPHSAKQQAQNTLSALNALVQNSKLKQSIRLKDLFGPDDLFDRAQKLLVAKMSNPGTARKYNSELNRIRSYAEDMLDDAELPLQFGSALQALMIRKEVNVSALARNVDVHTATISGWLRGVEPKDLSQAVVRRLEQFFDVEAGVLARRMVVRQARVESDDVLTPAVRQRLFAAGVPASFLPDDWKHRTTEQKQEILSWIWTNIADAPPYRRYLKALAQEEFSYAPLPTLMRLDFEALKEFKTAEIPDAQVPRSKASKLRGGSAQSDGHWREATATIMYKGIQRLVHALQAITQESGHDLAWTEQVGLGILAHSGCVRSAMEAIARRRFSAMTMVNAFDDMQMKPPKSRAVYTLNEARLVGSIAAFFDEETGYFFHRPPHVAAVPDVVPEHWAEKARAHWQDIARAACRELRTLEEHIANAARQLRDPWDPIAPLLERSDPLTPVFQALDRMGRDRPDPASAPIAGARHDRNHLLISILLHTRLRRFNLATLTWKVDNSGHLRQHTDGTWFLCIPQDELKNEGSPALPPKGEPLVIDLDPDDESLYESIERYLVGSGASRTILLPSTPTHALFVGQEGQMDPTTVHNIVLSFSARYLAECPWREGGIAGVRPFGPHAIRHLAATHVIKLTGTYEAAALALNDSVSTLKKAYAKFGSQEKSRFVSKLIKSSVLRTNGE